MSEKPNNRTEYSHSAILLYPQPYSSSFGHLTATVQKIMSNYFYATFPFFLFPFLLFTLLRLALLCSINGYNRTYAIHRKMNDAKGLFSTAPGKQMNRIKTPAYNLMSDNNLACEFFTECLLSAYTFRLGIFFM